MSAVRARAAKDVGPHGHLLSRAQGRDHRSHGPPAVGVRWIRGAQGDALVREAWCRNLRSASERNSPWGQVAEAVTDVPTVGSTADSTGDPVVVVLATTVPLAPVAPVAPAGPRAPVAPVAPAGPRTPVSPVAPFAPADPVAPAGPCGPGTPWTPCGPVAPWAPAGPWGPATASGDDTYERTPMPRAAAASTTAIAIPPRIIQSSFDCLACCVGFIGRRPDLSYLLSVSKAYESGLLVLGVCHLHGAPSRPTLYEQLAPHFVIRSDC